MVPRKWIGKETVDSSNATAPSMKKIILDLPIESRDIIWREFLLELYESKDSYAENELPLLVHLRAFRKKMNTLTEVPGFTASNILAKKSILLVSMQLFFCNLNSTTHPTNSC